jgi:hypothetical protein
MLIHIELNTTSYLPEAYAYYDFLISCNYDVILSQDYKGYQPDLVIKFLGFSFNSRIDNKFSIIHEYSSSSVPPLPHIKNYLKSTLNAKPNGRIFLNNFVKTSFNFNDNVPFIFRDMGIDKLFFDLNYQGAKKYDIIYCGTEHIGLKSALIKLVDFKFKIVLVGNFSIDLKNAFKSNKYFTFLGRLDRNELPHIYKLCRFGLNYTPDIFPYNSQTSTKTLEYCAAGLGVISNRYFWVENFIKVRNGKFLWLDEISTRDSIEYFKFITPNLEDLKWNLILENSGFSKFIDQCLFDK